MHRKGCPLCVHNETNYFGFQISVIMSNQPNLDKLPEKKNSSSDAQEHGHSMNMIEMLLDKVVKLEKGLKDLQLQGCAPCHMCKVSLGPEQQPQEEAFGLQGGPKAPQKAFC